jgi:hypothetical protein
MSDSFLRDRTGKIVARQDSDGWLRDGVGNLVAKLDKDGYTRNREGFIVGPGDQRLRELGKRLTK